ncbi:hypothetical protein L1049_028281 [Liquidambar formosana]|uniref:Uncharacterized protein n=1 Tax=Liquidambar formosana TaxID=63359 RepID=A0AAP0RIH6_LIQFO
MLDPANDLLPPQSSPTISSVSSSDLDTESTGSFFHDRSTTLGTLMGVSFPAISFRPHSQPSETHVPAAGNDEPSSAGNTPGGCGGGGGRRSKRGKNQSKKALVVAAERRRRWWKLCSDDTAKPASLGDFLEVERRFGDGAFYGAAAELEGVVVPPEGNGQRLLFADGRVLPPAQVEESPSTAAVLCRFPLSGICSG